MTVGCSCVEPKNDTLWQVYSTLSDKNWCYTKLIEEGTLLIDSSKTKKNMWIGCISDTSRTCQVCANPAPIKFVPMGTWFIFKSPCNVGANTIRVFGADDIDGQEGLRIGL